MKKYIVSIVILFSMLINFNNQGFAQKPDYEKYGRMAIAVVAADYPGHEIREYEYLGRKKIDETHVVDSFRFQVQENNQKFDVTVKVSHDLANKKLVNITVESQKQ